MLKSVGGSTSKRQRTRVPASGRPQTSCGSVGRDVLYAAQENGSRGAEGRFEAKETQDYCWMWSRKAGPAAAVRLRLERER